MIFGNVIPTTPPAASTMTANKLAERIYQVSSNSSNHFQSYFVLFSLDATLEWWHLQWFEKWVSKRCFLKRLFFFFLRKVKETLRIAELKQHHPDRWEQHKNAQIQQRQIEQRIGLRLRQIYSARWEQSTTIFNELNRLQTMNTHSHLFTW